MTEVLPPNSPRQRTRWTALAAISLIALHACLLIGGVVNLGVTNDETAHLTAGYSYWRHHDYRLQPENGNLPQRWGALPLLALSPRLVASDAPDDWRRSNVWKISQHFFFESGNNIEYILFCGRACMAFWSVALAILIYAWARALWGDSGALLALALFSVSPTILAHGALVTSDMCAAFFLLAASGAWWRLLERVTWVRLAASLVVTGMAFVAKFSCVLLPPIFVVLALLRISQSSPWGVAFRRDGWELRSPRSKAFASLGLGLAHTAAIFVSIWTFFGWRHTGFSADIPSARYFLSWETLLADNGVLTQLIKLALKSHLLPEAYVEGFAHVRFQGAARGAFLLGEYSITGWWWFFPYAFIAKSTIGELIATFMIAGTCIYRLASRSPSSILSSSLALAPLLAFSVVYGAFSLSSTLNIGHRHILPLYAVLFILSGSLLHLTSSLKSHALAIFLVTVSSAESLTARSHAIEFFNRLVGGPYAGWKQLVDSSLDWGQGLPELAQWLKNNPSAKRPLYVSYFGNDDYRFHGIHAQPLAPIYQHDRPREWFLLKEGTYCLGATMLQDVYSPFAGPWDERVEKLYQKERGLVPQLLKSGELSPVIMDFGRLGTERLWMFDRLRFARLVSYLKVRGPDDFAGPSMLIYNLTEREVNTVVDGSTSAFADLIEAQFEHNTSLRKILEPK